MYQEIRKDLQTRLVAPEQDLEFVLSGLICPAKPEGHTFATQVEVIANLMIGAFVDASMSEDDGRALLADLTSPEATEDGNLRCKIFNEAVGPILIKDNGDIKDQLESIVLGALFNTSVTENVGTEEFSEAEALLKQDNLNPAMYEKMENFLFKWLEPRVTPETMESVKQFVVTNRNKGLAQARAELEQQGLKAQAEITKQQFNLEDNSDAPANDSPAND